jgi:hypothetical protein
VHSPLVCDPCSIILLHLFKGYTSSQPHSAVLCP